jgi:hypothetical protein
MNTTASTAGCYFVTTVAGVPTTPETKRGSSVFVLISGLTIIASATNPAFAQTTSRARTKETGHRTIPARRVLSALMIFSIP